MPTYKTPGVYVEEIATFPPSVAEVETAIPAFIGFTEKNPNPKDQSNKPVRITSLLDYQLYFGGADTEGDSIVVSVNDNDDITVAIDATKKSNSVMYYAMQLYFSNGGGPCFIVSVGGFDQNPKGAPASKIDPYKGGLDQISKEDEPTLLVFPDAPFSLQPNDYYQLINDAIQQCTKLGDRFTIADVLVADPVDTRASTKAFRDKIAGSENVNLKYGAAYFPYLNTLITYDYDETKLQSSADTVATKLQADKKAQEDKVNAAKTAADAAKAALDAAQDDAGKKTAFTQAKNRLASEESKLRDINTQLDSAAGAALNSIITNKIKQKMNQLGVLLSPCGAMAGVYASVDSARGVWKAPANVSLSNVQSTTVKITDDDQDDMNIDVVDGKSVNAIRPFPGKGIKVWGARTLTGNDNEWRYISVRRFFNMVEESVKKSTYWAVFEPNDINTWVKVRAMIENYLILKWRDGALAGAKPEEAFYVRVGLGQTMSQNDVLEGRMIIEIGMAVVRPAEFIILKFSHKLQTS